MMDKATRLAWQKSRRETIAMYREDESIEVQEKKYAEAVTKLTAAMRRETS